LKAGRIGKLGVPCRHEKFGALAPGLWTEHLDACFFIHKTENEDQTDYNTNTKDVEYLIIV
jgi:hypothetical protein